MSRYFFLALTVIKWFHISLFLIYEKIKSTKLRAMCYILNSSKSNSH